ncbi:hypothetical protein D3C87_2067950 [compost metagenome]
MIMLIFDTNPARTAAWPSTSAPAIEMDCPIIRGILLPASLKISNVISSIKISSTDGNGMPCRWAAMLVSSIVGISS